MGASISADGSLRPRKQNKDSVELAVADMTRLKRIIYIANEQHFPATQAIQES